MLNRAERRDKHLVAQSEDVISNMGGTSCNSNRPSVVQLQAKIGKLTMEKDCLEKALGKSDRPGARR
jgi:hypothetical protein